MPRSPPRVLLTNDDGPPDAKHSMFLHEFRQALIAAGWPDVRVVVPDGQRSWSGKAYAIAEECTGTYFYPRGKGGFEGEKTRQKRPLREGETAEYILLSSTPAACASIGLHNIHRGDIDICISGPNVGRNSSTAFAMSSGTLGAAMSAAISGVPAIAVSYGIFERPAPQNLVDEAHKAAVHVCKQLWEHSFSGTPDLYTVNIPLSPELLQHDGDIPRIEWTTMARTNYGRLFAAVEAETSTAKESGDIPGADGSAQSDSTLRFKFKPDIGPLLNPSASEIAEGTDSAAMHAGIVSVTPLQTAFADGPIAEALPVSGRRWKL